jgi:hypothetical protein
LVNAGEVVERTGSFALSQLCGVAVPLCPLAAEYWVKSEIDGSSWFAAGVTYFAGVGLASRRPAIMIAMLLGAALLAFFYGVNMQLGYDAVKYLHLAKPPPLDASPARILIGVAAAIYYGERVVRHLFKGEPFLEFSDAANRAGDQRYFPRSFGTALNPCGPRQYHPRQNQPFKLAPKRYGRPVGSP